MKTVLIAEENAEIRWTVKYNLLCKGYAVQEVSNGHQVLGAVRSCHPDLIILDAHLPGVDGVQVLHDLKEDPCGRDVPVLMVGHLGTNRNIYQSTRGLVEGVFNKKSLNLLGLMYLAQKVMDREIFKKSWVQADRQLALVA